MLVVIVVIMFGIFGGVCLYALLSPKTILNSTGYFWLISCFVLFIIGYNHILISFVPTYVYMCLFYEQHKGKM